MRTLQIVIRSLQCGCALWTGLLLAASAGAQQIVRLPAEDRRLTIDFEELYRLGTMAGEDWEQFGHIGGAAFDGAGNLFLFDRLMETQIVFMVGPDGRLVRQLGGPGEGPGEFAGAGAMAVFADGRVAVADLSRRGYHLFAADGEFERLVRMAEPTGITSVGQVVAQPGAEAVIGVPTLATAWRISGAAFSTPVSFPTSHPFERTILSGEETVTDTVIEAWLPTVDIGGMDQTDLVNAAPRPTSELPEFSPDLHWGVLPDGRVVFSDSTTYAVKVVEAGVGVVRILSRPFHPELSVIRGLATTWDGHIWVCGVVRVPGTTGPSTCSRRTAATWAAILPEPTGLPAAFGPDGLAAFIEVSELGVQTVVVKRMNTGVAPP